MEQMTITAKIQIIAAEADKVLLDETMSVYRNACNYVSDYVFRTHDLKQFSLNKALYSTLREKFNLKSQMAQSVLKTVIARYKTILENQNEWIKPSFKKPQYDLVWNRDYSLTQNCFSINTLNGRVKLSYFSDGMSKYFDHTIYKFGTARLVNKHGKYYLHIPVTYEVEESNISDICNVVGIDCIGLGSDFDGISQNLEMKNASYLPQLEKALKDAGLTTEEIEKVFYKNVLRVYREVLKQKK